MSRKVDVRKETLTKVRIHNVPHERSDSGQHRMRNNLKSEPEVEENPKLPGILIAKRKFR